MRYNILSLSLIVVSSVAFPMELAEEQVSKKVKIENPPVTIMTSLKQLSCLIITSQNVDIIDLHGQGLEDKDCQNLQKILEEHKLKLATIKVLDISDNCLEFKQDWSLSLLWAWLNQWPYLIINLANNPVLPRMLYKGFADLSQAVKKAPEKWQERLIILSASRLELLNNSLYTSVYQDFVTSSFIPKDLLELHHNFYQSDLVKQLLKFQKQAKEQHEQAVYKKQLDLIDKRIEGRLRLDENALEESDGPDSPNSQRSSSSSESEEERQEPKSDLLPADYPLFGRILTEEERNMKEGKPT